MYDKDDRQITFCMMPKDVYEGILFLSALVFFHLFKEPYRAWCQLATTDVYGNKVQCESGEITPNDCKKHYKRHGFDEVKAPNYMYIFEIGAFDRVQIKYCTKYALNNLA